MWFPIVGTFRTLCFAPTPEGEELFEELEQLAVLT
jgi:hypothetical protein